jgi:hypothetical protein
MKDRYLLRATLIEDLSGFDVRRGMTDVDPTPLLGENRRGA